MKNEKAFTLIELLVVVLIIGILAAVALPQYQKVVEKSHAIQAITTLKGLYQAYEVFYLDRGNPPTDLSELLLSSAFNGHYSYVSGSGTATATSSNNDWSLSLYYSTEDLRGMCIVRISGAYAGAGWCIWKNIPPKYAALKAGQLYCIERTKNSAVIFGLSGGKYCQGIFNGQLARWDSSFSAFSI